MIGPSTVRSRLLAGCACLWLAAIALGMRTIMEYASTPGDPGGPPPLWPVDSAMCPPAGRPVLVMMAHPRCPCTRASLEELSRLLARVDGRLDTRVLFYAPAGADEEWWKTDLWRNAASIPGVETILDEDAVESRRFGTETSGHALLYDGRGRLLYSGGITVARGHVGDNAGRDAVEAILKGDPTARRRSPVFGCALHERPAGAAASGDP